MVLFHGNNNLSRVRKKDDAGEGVGLSLGKKKQRHHNGVCSLWLQVLTVLAQFPGFYTCVRYNVTNYINDVNETKRKEAKNWGRPAHATQQASNQDEGPQRNSEEWVMFCLLRCNSLKM